MQKSRFTFVNFYIFPYAYIEGTRGEEAFETSKNHAYTWSFPRDNRF